MKAFNGYQFLKYMYKDSIKPDEINCRVLMAAHKYNFEKLVRECFAHLLVTVDADTVIEFIKCAYLINNERLFEEAVLVLQRYYHAGLNQEDLNTLYDEYPGLPKKICDLFLNGCFQ